VAIRLLDASGALVRTGAIAQDPKEKTVFAVPTNAPLANGQYTIAWRGMGVDGHVVQGNLTFRVTTP
jgi:methionine-rich copper-binding protein CopC